MKNFIKGENTCNTIEDVFHNKHLIRYLSLWYKKEHEGDKLNVWIDSKNHEAGFTPEFYSFVQEIFSTVDSRKPFLKYVGERLTSKPKLYSKIKEGYGIEGIVILILSIDGIEEYFRYNRSSLFSYTSIHGAFKRDIVDILDMSQMGEMTEPGKIPNTPYDTIYCAVEELDSPISHAGNFLMLHEKVNRVRFRVQSLGRKKLMDVNRKGKVLGPQRQKQSTEGGTAGEISREGWHEVNSKFEPFKLNDMDYKTVREVLEDLKLYNEILACINDRVEATGTKFEFLKKYYEDRLTDEEREKYSLGSFIVASRDILLSRIQSRPTTVKTVRILHTQEATKFCVVNPENSSEYADRAGIIPDMKNTSAPGEAVEGTKLRVIKGGGIRSI